MERVVVLDKPFAYSVYKCFKCHALHAHAITFSHPVSQEVMTIQAPLAIDFLEALEKFKGEEKK